MNVLLEKDLLNSKKILFHYGKMLEDISRGKTDFSPIAIEIHPTAKCNHRCIHCSYMERNESRVSLDKKVMERLVDSIIKMNIRAVYFSGGGEPTVYPGLKDYIAKLTSNGVEVAIITNGSYFDKAGLIDIADRLNYVAISVPGVDEKTFSEITGVNDMEDVLSLPGKIKKVHGTNSPVLGARIVVTNVNYKYVPEFLQTMKEREFDYALFKIVRDYEDNGQGLNADKEDFLKNEIANLGNIDINFTNLDTIFNYRNPIEFRNKCWINNYGLLANVSMDGKVYPNIVEIDKPEFCIGDLNENTLEEIWNSDRHKVVKELSNAKWLKGDCRNCRAMSYNNIINELHDAIPTKFDPFI